MLLTFSLLTLPFRDSISLVHKKKWLYFTENSPFLRYKDGASVFLFRQSVFACFHNGTKPITRSAGQIQRFLMGLEIVQVVATVR